MADRLTPNILDPNETGRGWNGTDTDVTDPATGQRYVYDGVKWNAVPDDFDVGGGLGQGLEAVATRVGRGIQSMVTGDPEAERLQREAAQTLNAQRSLNPVATFFSEAAPYAAAAPAGVFGLPAAVGAEALIGSTEDPDNPLLGAVLGGAGTVGGAYVGRGAQRMMRGAAEATGGFSGRVVNTVRAATGETPAQAIMRQTVAKNRKEAASAAREAAPAPESTMTGGGAASVPTGSRTDFLAPDELDALMPADAKLTPGQRWRLGSLRNDPDPNVAGGRMGTDFNIAQGIRMAGAESQDATGEYFTRRQLQNMEFTKMIGRELGQNIEGGAQITPDVIRAARKDAQEIFEKYGDEAARATDLGTVLPRFMELEDEAPAEAKRYIKRVVERLEMAQRDGVFTGREWGATRRLLDKGRRQYREDPVVQDFLEEGLGILEEPLWFGDLPNVREDLQEARRAWRVIKTLERGATMTPDGAVNVKTFFNNWSKIRGVPTSFARGETEDRFERAVRTFAVMNQVPFNSSGTAERLSGTVRNLLSRGANAAGIPVP